MKTLKITMTIIQGIDNDFEKKVNDTVLYIMGVSNDKPIVKFGVTNNLTRRLEEHRRKLGSNELYLYYIVVFSQDISRKNIINYERSILDDTKDYTILENFGTEFRRLSPDEMLLKVADRLFNNVNANANANVNANADFIILKSIGDNTFQIVSV